MSGKYGNRPTAYSGRTYASAGEAEYAAHLDVLKAAGAIKDWEPQVPFVLVDVAHPWKLVGRGKAKKPARVRVTLVADFRVWAHDGTYRVVDFKGVETAVWKLKASLWLVVYPNIPLLVVKADGTETRV